MIRKQCNNRLVLRGGNTKEGRKMRIKRRFRNEVGEMRTIGQRNGRKRGGEKNGTERK